MQQHISAKKLFEYIVSKIKIHQKGEQSYEKNETEAIAYIFLEYALGLTKTDIIINKELTLDEQIAEQVDTAIKRLRHGEPIQYIMGEAYFYGRKYAVNKEVLIPRRETEELVNIILDENQKSGLKVLDIGTGTGCIAISLQKELKLAEVHGIDISDKAMQIAKINNNRHEAHVKFHLHDIFKDSFFAGNKVELSNFDIVVSNPPYVRKSEARYMEKNVLNYEPHLALFVEDENPLKFYKQILKGIKNANSQFLTNGGSIYFEINEAFGPDLVTLLTSSGFEQVRIVKDMQKKDRIVTGLLNKN